MILLFDIGFLDVSWVDIIDISLVSILMYQVYKLMRGSVALTIFLGFLSLYLIYLVVGAAGMELVTTILNQFMEVGVIAAIILFQQEIRKFLLLIGKTTDLNREYLFKGFLGIRNGTSKKGFQVNPIVEAVKAMGGSNTGALIVLSKDSELKFYVESGDAINAKVSKRLLLAIFNKFSPLHDGAVIIHQGVIKAARCILPVTERDDLPANLGLRHRAAIGMSEVTGAMVIIVSEETGEMSVVIERELFKNLSSQELRKKINDYLFENQVEKKEKKKKNKAEKTITELIADSDN
ncbi:diadenylate cyclase CdaA [Fulvivirgaceae bacterium BMA12]|uniref:Diadenylate cyclase n=1 Tax=Agaribacillus aureus TaxID=3051825 RepID=A0ABT8L4A2_9BACT|nr:diadenylate cyclase CdaA [Fulvivirgaceae bacterium BMA12]